MPGFSSQGHQDFAYKEIKFMKSRTLWSVVVIALTVIGLLTWTQRGQSAAKIQWEYYTDEASRLSAGELNKLGLEGWELVNVAIRDEQPAEYIFKRQK
jgi:hypothetical protein